VIDDRTVGELDPSSPTQVARQRSFVWYQASVAVALLSLITATYRLWFPGTEFPLIPMFGFLADTPIWVDWILSTFLGVCTVAVIFLATSPTWRSWFWLAIAVLLVGTFLLSQHRLQPWAYQFAIVAAIFAWSSPSHATSHARYLALGIYFFSAISKLNASFVDELGADFLLTIGKWIGGWENARNVEPYAGLSLIFPAFELLAFVLLASPWTRRYGVVAAAAMHVGLLLVLGPWGLNHSLGVLLWNLFFIFQACLLFWPTSEQPRQAAEQGTSIKVATWKLNPAPVLVLIAALVVPLGDWLGLSDPWPAWALYDSRVGRTSCFVSKFAATQLPEDWQKYVALETIDLDYVQFDIRRWSLDQTAAPIYPGRRFSFALSRAMTDRLNLSRFTRLVVQHPADRLTGERQSDVVPGGEAANYAQREFWLNTNPRSAFLKRPKF